MTNLNDIASKIYSDKTKIHQDMINSFEAFQNDIENANLDSSTELYTLKTRLFSDYAIALTYTKNFKKAIQFIEKALTLLLNDVTIDKNNIQKIKFYELLIFNRAVSNYHLGNHSISKADFKLLIQLYPDNKIYRGWLNSHNNLSLNKIKNALWILTAFLLLSEMVLKYFNLPNKILLFLTILSLAIVAIIEIIIFFKKRQIRKQPYST